MADKIRKLNDDFCISDSLSEFTLPGNLPRGIKVFQAYNDTSTIVSFKVNENRCFEIAMAKESSSLKFRSSDGSGWTSWGGVKPYISRLCASLKHLLKGGVSHERQVEESGSYQESGISKGHNFYRDILQWQLSWKNHHSDNINSPNKRRCYGESGCHAPLWVRWESFDRNRYCRNPWGWIVKVGFIWDGLKRKYHSDLQCKSGGANSVYLKQGVLIRGAVIAHV